jgi:hypothetical protein
LSPLNNVIHQLVFCEGGHSVDTVLVGGEIVVKGGRLTRLREETLMRRVEPISKKMRKLYSTILKSETPSAESAVKRLYRDAFKDQRRNFRL